MTATPPGWNPDESGEHLRHWSGSGWSPAQSTDPADTGRPTPGRGWRIAAVGALVVLLAFGGIRWWLAHSTEQQRWSLWPHTMGCAAAPRPDHPAPAPPPAVRAEQVSVETIDGAKVAVVIEFAAPPPGPSEQVRSPYGGMMDAPGSLQLMFYVTAPHLGSPPFRKVSVCCGSVCCCGTTRGRDRLAAVLGRAA